MSQTTPSTSLTSSLYVGDLAPEVTEQHLYDAFLPFGNVYSIRVCRDQQSKLSLGYGYVNFQARENAERAKEVLNYSSVCGKPIRISWQERDPTARRANIGNIFIKGLAESVDSKSLYDAVSQFGNIKSLVVRHKPIIAGKEKKQSTYGFVQFENAEDAEKAITVLNGKKIEGAQVTVQHFVRRENRGNSADNYTNLYIKPLPKENFTLKDLTEVFGKYGEIQNPIIMTDEKGLSRGFGFVNYKNHENAVQAEKELNGFELKGVKILVCKAEPKAVRDKRMKKLYESRKKDMKNKTKGLNLYVKNLAESIDKERLKTLFAKFGDISSCVVMKDQKTQVSRGFGFCCFNTEQAAQQAMTDMNGQLIEGKQLYVNFAQTKEERRALIEKQRQYSMNPAIGVYPYQYATYGYGYPQAQYQQQTGYYQKQKKQHQPMNQGMNPAMPQGMNPVMAQPIPQQAPIPEQQQ